MTKNIAVCFAILFAALMLICGLTAITVASLGYSLVFAYVFVALSLLSAVLFWNAVNSVESL